MDFEKGQVRLLSIYFYSLKAGRLIPRVLERRREREERETRDENDPDEQVVEANDENESSGNRNIDADLPSPRDVAQTLAGSSHNEGESNGDQDDDEQCKDTETL